MELTDELREGVLVITVVGTVSEGGADMDAFTKRLSALADPAVAVGKSIVFDLSQCDQLHGGFRPLMFLRRNAPEHIHIAMAALQPLVLEKCRMRRVDWVVPVYETVQQAVAATINPPVPVQTIRGFAFESDLTLAELKLRLRDVTGTDWKDGDSAYYGDYLGGRLSAEAVVRIYSVKIGYVANLRFYSKARDAIAQLQGAQSRLVNVILPAIGCRNARPCEPLE